MNPVSQVGTGFNRKTQFVRRYAKTAKEIIYGYQLEMTDDTNLTGLQRAERSDRWGESPF